jgi:hypothetical protein
MPSPVLGMMLTNPEQYSSTIVVVGIVLFIARAVWRVKNSPHRPRLSCWIDTLMEIPAKLKIGPWGIKPTVQQALGIAKHRTRLTDVGPGGEEEFLKKGQLVWEIGMEKSNATLSPAGQVVYFEAIVTRMIDKLRFIDYLKNHPDIEKTPIKPPIFVIGFPRTGTTFLHELLGLNEKVRSHYSWEQISIVPTTDKEDIESQAANRIKRYNGNKTKFNFLFKYLISERIQHIHRIAYDEPEECTLPLAMELPLGLTQLPFMVYAAKQLFPMGAGVAYKQYYKILQLLTWQAKDRRGHDFTWMLKCPFHLPYLEELFEAFPCATVVWTHRDPAECIASACSLYETIMHMSMEESSVDPKSIGKAVLEYSKLSLEKAHATLEKLGDKVKVVHVKYMDTVKDPKSVCQKVYAKADMPFTAEYEEKLDAYLKKNAEERTKSAAKKSSGVLHSYKAEDFGLTNDQIQSEFKDYIDRYGLLEKKK